MADLLSVNNAIELVLQNCPPAAGSEILSIQESFGRVLAEDLPAPDDSPRFDKSMMDGFAIQLPHQVANPQSTYEVTGTVTAGSGSSVVIRPGEAIRIMTGAEVPPGVNCVVPMERVSILDGDTKNPRSIQVPAEVLSIDACITRKGGIIKAGSPLLKKGVRVAATHVAALAEFGIKNVPAIRQPRVAILATGDELVDAASEPNAGQIRNSNEPMLEAQVKNCRCWPIPLGIARDNREELAARIRQGLTADVLLLTGGVSVGIHDFVPSELAAANVRKVFHGVKMKPGKPIWFGIYETAPAPQQPPHRCLVYGLPGNPVSSLVCFELFVRPALQLLQAQPERTAFQAKLKEDAIVRGDRPVYHPAVLTLSKDAAGITAQIIPWGGSSDVCTTASANGMALLQPEHGPYKAGDTVEARLWTEFFHD